MCCGKTWVSGSSGVSQCCRRKMVNLSDGTSRILSLKIISEIQTAQDERTIAIPTESLFGLHTRPTHTFPDARGSSQSKYDASFCQFVKRQLRESKVNSRRYCQFKPQINEKLNLYRVHTEAYPAMTQSEPSFDQVETHPMLRLR